jgi:hypothetical protein
MECQRCGLREATIHLTTLNEPEGFAEEQHLCQECAGPIDQLADLSDGVQRAGGDAWATPQAQAEVGRLMAELMRRHLSSSVSEPAISIHAFLTGDFTAEVAAKRIADHVQHTGRMVDLEATPRMEPLQAALREELRRRRLHTEP